MKFLASILVVSTLLSGCGMTNMSDKRATATKDKISDQQNKVVDGAIETTGNSVSRGINGAIENAISNIFN